MLLDAKTKYGAVRGIPTMHETVSEFRGIPYAKPPVGELRWKAPQKPDAWEGVRDCNAYGPACIQVLYPEGNFYKDEFYTHRYHKYPPLWGEDCLYLNVWTPAKKADEKLPVFIWVHGGGFTRGYSNETRTNCEALAAQGVVAVSFNYRLGVLGYFAHPDLSKEQGGHSGNYGYMDQMAAIKWVHENIDAFGGDPDCITIAGQSAGAMAVEELSCNPEMKGVFKRAIMQSGVQASPVKYGFFYKSKEAVEGNGSKFSEFTGKDLAGLKALPVQELVDKFAAFTAAGNPDFGPACEDGYMFTENPGDSWAKGKAHIDGLLIGATTFETQLMPRIDGVTRANIKEKVRACLDPEFWALGDVELKTDRDADKLINMWFAWYMNNTSKVLCEFMDQRYGKKAYSYLFARNVPGADNPGPFHSACLWYMFGNLRYCERPFTKADYELSTNMNTYWANFVKTGDPNGEGLPVWEPYTHERPLSIVLDVDDYRMEDTSKPYPPASNLMKILLER